MNILRSTAVMASLTAASRVLGMVREILIVRTLGASPLADAYYTALQFPNLFRRVFAEGAFSQAFVPLFSRTRAAEGDGEAQRVASETLSALLAATAALTIAAQLVMPAIMLVFQWGYAARGQWDIFWLSVFLTQITMPYLACMSLAALFQGVLNTHSRFALAAGAPTILNLFLIAPALMFREHQVMAAYALAASVTLAGIAQAGMLYWGVRRLGVRLSLPRPRLTPAVRRVVAVAVPGAIAASSVQINILVSQALASLEEGAKTWLNTADRLYQLPLGLVGVALGVAILPTLSRSVASEDHEEAQSTMDQALAIAMALTLPAAAALMAIPTLLVDVLFVRGAFTAMDGALTGAALFHFGWGVPAFVLIKVLAPAFYARHDTVRPMRYAMISVAVNIAVGAGLFWVFSQAGRPGFIGLAIGTSAAAWLNVALLLGVLVRERIYAPGGRAMRRVAGALAAAALMAVALVLADAEFARVRDLAFGRKELAIVPVVAGGAAAYFAAALLFGALRLSDIKALMRKPRGAPATPPGPEGV